MKTIIAILMKTARKSVRKSIVKKSRIPKKNSLTNQFVSMIARLLRTGFANLMKFVFVFNNGKEKIVLCLPLDMMFSITKIPNFEKPSLKIQERRS